METLKAVGERGKLRSRKEIKQPRPEGNERSRWYSGWGFLTL